jgi:citrate lyase beta subunit
MPDIYQFIKYNSETSIESLEAKCKSGAIICFDLEDSIFNWIDETKGPGLKQDYRKWLNNILRKLKAETIPLKIGIRLNSFDSGEQQLDLESIPDGTKIHTILVPKVETAFDIDSLAERLTAKNLNISEIIPIIESREGLHNLECIVSCKYPVLKMGFGHCDYNLSIGSFPFFHQDSTEYWKWVNRIIAVLKTHNCTFINSAYLNLGDSAFFQSMLAHLQFICQGNFGQFTLSYQQILLCNTFSKQPNSIAEIGRNRLDLSINKEMLLSLKSTFEAENKGQGFSMTSDTKTLTSPQEYISAKQHLASWKENTIHFTFVGGCFPVQSDILFEEVFHRILAKKAEDNLNVNFNVNIIRYEKFSNCLQRIIKYNEHKPIDYLAFHIRPEPYLRIIKLYYKYLNSGNKLQASLNLPFLGILNPEKYDLLSAGRRNSYDARKNRSGLYYTLINCNYMFGYLIGNHTYAKHKYLSLVKDVIEFCNNRKIKVIILGPAIRSETFFEAILSKKLEKFMSKSLKNADANYIFGLVKHQDKGKKYFQENGIHATELYHTLIANRIYEAIGEEETGQHIHNVPCD